MHNRNDSLISVLSGTTSRSNSASPTPGLVTDAESDGYASDWFETETPRRGSPLPSYTTGPGPEDVVTQIPPGWTFTIYEDPPTPPSFVDSVEALDDSDTSTIRDATSRSPTSGVVGAGRSRSVSRTSGSPDFQGVAVPPQVPLRPSPSLFSEVPDELSDTDGSVNDENAPPPEVEREFSRHEGKKRRASISSSASSLDDSSSRDSSLSPSRSPGGFEARLGGQQEPLYKRRRQDQR
jgi:hypothetical protein